MPESARVIFFDLGDTLGTAVLSSSRVHLVAFEVFQFFPGLLRHLNEGGHRLGIISNTGDDGGDVVDGVLADAQIIDFFQPKLRLYSKDIGLKKDSAAIF